MPTTSTHKLLLVVCISSDQIIYNNHSISNEDDKRAIWTAVFPHVSPYLKWSLRAFTGQSQHLTDILAYLIYRTSDSVGLIYWDNRDVSGIIMINCWWADLIHGWTNTWSIIITCTFFKVDSNGKSCTKDQDMVLDVPSMCSFDEWTKSLTQTISNQILRSLIGGSSIM